MGTVPAIPIQPAPASADWSSAVGANPTDASTLGKVVQGIDDVSQCLGIIIMTPRGSDILRPTFGCNLFSYIDKPINRALPHIVREITAQITLWEPRVTLISVTAAPVLDGSSQTGAKLLVTVTYQLQLTGATRTVTVPIGKLALLPLGAGV